MRAHDLSFRGFSYFHTPCCVKPITKNKVYYVGRIVREVFLLFFSRYNDGSLETRLARIHGAPFENDCSVIVSLRISPAFLRSPFLVAAARKNGEETNYKYARATRPLLQPARVSIVVNPTRPAFIATVCASHPDRYPRPGRVGQC